MAHRSTVRKGLDRKLFKHTAAKSKRINIMPKVMRGGIRL